MASSEWTTSASIVFSSNGAKVMEGLSEKATALERVMAKLQATTNGAASAYDLFAASVARASAAMARFTAEATSSGSATDKATAGVYRASTAYNVQTVAATRAAAAVAALNRQQSFGLLPPATRRIALGPGVGTDLALGDDIKRLSSGGDGYIYQGDGVHRQAFGADRANYENIEGYSARNQASPYTNSPFAQGPGNVASGGSGFASGGGGASIPPGGSRGAASPGAGGYGGAGAAGAAAARAVKPNKFLTHVADSVQDGFSTIGGYAVGAAKGAALVTAGLTVDALVEAGKLQQRLSVIRAASPGLFAPTPGNNAVMDNLKAEAYNISNATAQSVAQSADIMAVIAASGISAHQMMEKDKSGQTFAMDVAKYADTQYLKTHGKVSFEEGAIQAIKFAHLYGAYSPDQIKPLLDGLTKVSFQMPDSVSKLVTQSAYYAKLFSRFGVPQDQSIVLGAWLDRMGGGSRGGTWLQQVLLQTQKPLNVSAHVQSGRQKALEYFGLVDSKGKLDPKIFGFDPKTGKPTTDMFDDKGDGLLQRFNEIIQRDRNAAATPEAKATAERLDIQRFNQALGIQGERIPLLADQQGIDVLLALVKNSKNMPGVNQAQASFMANFDSTAVRAWSNFQSLLTEIGEQALPGMTKGLGDLADSLHSAQVWLHAHKKLELDIQHWVTSTVVETEKWLLGHHKDWSELNGDLKEFAGYVVTLGPSVKLVADNVVVLFDVFGETVKLFLGWGKSLNDVWNKSPWGIIDNAIGDKLKPWWTGTPPPPATTPTATTAQPTSRGAQDQHAAALDRHTRAVAAPAQHAASADHRDTRKPMREVVGARHITASLDRHTRAVTAPVHPPLRDRVRRDAAAKPTSTSNSHVSVGPNHFHIAAGNGDPKLVARQVEETLKRLSKAPRSMLYANTTPTHPSLPLVLNTGLG